MIELRSVQKRFGAVRAVRGVSLDVPAGQVVGVLGPNGAGKTTTVRMIAGVCPPTSGTVTVDGLDSVDDSLAVRRRLGYLPEANPLYPEMTVEGYLGFRGRLHGLGRRHRPRAVGRVVERCMLGDVRRRRIGQLSKGYRQRVGLAAALLHEPRVLILDEPTSGLDPAQIAETRSLMRDLAGERTTLIVSHILPEVERTCDRVVFFARGHVLADGDTRTLAELARAPGPAVEGGPVIVEARPEGPVPVYAVLRSVPGVAAIRAEELPGGWTRAVLDMKPGVGDVRDDVARLAARRRLRVREIRLARPGAQADGSLESLYLRLMAGSELPAADGGTP